MRYARRCQPARLARETKQPVHSIADPQCRGLKPRVGSLQKPAGGPVEVRARIVQGRYDGGLSEIYERL